ncbi:MAG: hypothetical protein DRR19_10850 [Candidatus Parabeggiatoa sp. nov. 1]|nr:MAG: hypothetical protein DRR19_10850 [Gammaproteobacteria bacterium]HEC85458.1 hypothetical protein [Thioploca sp.]
MVLARFVRLVSVVGAHHPKPLLYRIQRSLVGNKKTLGGYELKAVYLRSLVGNKKTLPTLRTNPLY